MAALENCEEYTPEQALNDFATGFIIELLVSDAFDVVAEYGLPVIVAGLRKHGYDNLAARLLQNAGDTVDNGPPKTKDPDGPNGPSCSFSFDTPVMTDNGLVFIGQLQAGDYALAFNEATGEIGYYLILAVWAHEDRVIQYLTIDGEQIVTTPNHPFYTGTGEWVPAGELQIGDTIRNGQWGLGGVEAIAFVYDPQPMYNLTVATAHTYFIGDGQWLVHNDCVGQALKNFRRKDFYAGGEQFSITKERMEHFLVRHHPTYWDGSTRTIQTFFDESLTVEQIANLAQMTVQQGYTNRTLSNAARQTYTYETIINGITYRARTEYGKLVQFYPLP